MYAGMLKMACIFAVFVLAVSLFLFFFILFYFATQRRIQ